jgi:hypothetical protein
MSYLPLPLLLIDTTTTTTRPDRTLLRMMMRRRNYSCGADGGTTHDQGSQKQENKATANENRATHTNLDAKCKTLEQKTTKQNNLCSGYSKYDS